MAALRNKIQTNAQPHLRPGEQVQGVVVGQTASNFLIIAGVIVFLIVNRYRTIVATNQRIIVFNAGRWSTTACKDVLLELPRSHLLGPIDATIWHRTPIGDETIRIHRRFHADVRAIDLGSTGGQSQAPR